jgi:hypothetical protein
MANWVIFQDSRGMFSGMFSVVPHTVEIRVLEILKW